MFRDGRFYGCISLAQAVIEALATSPHGTSPEADGQPGDTCAKAVQGRRGSRIAAAARSCVYGDRPQSLPSLKQGSTHRANKTENSENVEDLYDIESRCSVMTFPTKAR